jgi:hypothetical protein
MAPHTVISIPKKEKTYHLSGTSPIDMELSIIIAGKPLQTCKLVAGQYENISIVVNNCNAQTIELKFSNYIKDPAPRNLSFLVQSTDIFAECDLW